VACHKIVEAVALLKMERFREASRPHYYQRKYNDL
jgi:hypothetical protein